jgi:hypothetical protein
MLGHQEIKDQIQKRVFQSQTLAECDICLLEAYRKQTRPNWEVQPWAPFLQEEPRESAKEPDGAGKRDEDAERLRVVLRAVVGFDSFEDANHYGEHHDFSKGRDGEGHIRDAIAGE